MEIKDINKEIQDLENKKRLLLLEQSKQAWKIWHEEGIKFLESIKGRCFTTKNNDSFQLFKVIDYKKGNFLGNSEYKGFYEVITEGYFIVRSASYSQKFEIPYTPETPFGCFALKVNKKSKEIQATSQLNYINQSLNEACLIDISKVTKIQYRGDDYEDDSWAFEDTPTKSVKSWLKDYWNWYEVSQEFYNDCIKLANYIAVETDNLWSKYSKELENAQIIK